MHSFLSYRNSIKLFKAIELPDGDLDKTCTSNRIIVPNREVQVFLRGRITRFTNVARKRKSLVVARCSMKGVRYRITRIFPDGIRFMIYTYTVLASSVKTRKPCYSSENVSPLTDSFQINEIEDRTKNTKSLVLFYALYLRQ